MSPGAAGIASDWPEPFLSFKRAVVRLKKMSSCLLTELCFVFCFFYVYSEMQLFEELHPIDGSYTCNLCPPALFQSAFLRKVTIFS